MNLVRSHSIRIPFGARCDTRHDCGSKVRKGPLIWIVRSSQGFGQKIFRRTSTIRARRLLNKIVWRVQRMITDEGQFNGLVSITPPTAWEHVFKASLEFLSWYRSGLRPPAISQLGGLSAVIDRRYSLASKNTDSLLEQDSWSCMISPMPEEPKVTRADILEACRDMLRWQVYVIHTTRPTVWGR